MDNENLRLTIEHEIECLKQAIEKAKLLGSISSRWEGYVAALKWVLMEMEKED